MRIYIECRDCDSRSCAGCNIFILSKMLRAGKFDGIMDGNRKIKSAADVKYSIHSEWEITEVDHAHGSKCYHCPECGEDDWRYDEPNFCPNCGCDMRGEKHEAD